MLSGPNEIVFYIKIYVYFLEAAMTNNEFETPSNFEDAISELESIVSDMQNNKLSLEDSMNKYKRGLDLANFCKSKLDAAQAQITVMQEDGTKKPLEQNTFPIE